jgi:hypothetical protein
VQSLPGEIATPILGRSHQRLHRLVEQIERDRADLSRSAIPDAAEGNKCLEEVANAARQAIAALERE